MAEAVGFVLAVLPLVISAAEHYTQAANVFCRHHRFASEVANLAGRLKIQRAIFLAALHRLLAASFGSFEATQMLNDANHPTWRHEGTEHFFLERLGGCRDALIESIQMIRIKLGELEEKCSKFEDGINETTQFSNGLDTKKWCRQVGRKIKFAFRESHIQNSFNDVRDLTEDFCSLIREADQFQDQKPVSRPELSSNKDIRKFNTVQAAARNLYEALVSACTKHTEHQVHFSLQPSYTSSSPCPAHVRFTLAFRHVSMTRDGYDNEPMWFTVESVVTGIVAQAIPNQVLAVPDLNVSLKRGRSSPSPPPHQTSEKKRKKVVRFRSPSPPPSTLPLKLDPSLPDLCAHSNFCNQITSLLRGPTAKRGACIGFLKHTADSSHLVYIDSSAQSVTPGLMPTTSASISLSKMLRNMHQEANSGNSTMPQYDKIRLAKQLAMAVLSYHATPWLKGSWNSDEAFLYGNDAAKPGVVSVPYIDVSVKGPHGSLSRASTLPCRTFAPNTLLFGLGESLLELAFGAPLRALQRQIDTDGDQEDRYTEFFVAKRLSKIVTRQLGPKYAQIVRKCLHCDFVRGDDLEEPALQQGFYQEVVCELEELETRFRNCYLGD